MGDPYIPINKVFEFTDQKGIESAWLLASFVDQYIRKHAFSCYFSKTKSIPYFNKLIELGFLLPEMEKRKQTLLNLINSNQG